MLEKLQSSARRPGRQRRSRQRRSEAGTKCAPPVAKRTEPKKSGSDGLCPRTKTCEAIRGIIEEGQEVMKEFKGKPALDAGLLAAAQTVEHYEISRYGSLKTWAAELGLNQAVKLLDATLAEEKKTDATLTKIARSRKAAAWLRGPALGRNGLPESATAIALPP
jgi:hypothetical protein